MAVWIWPLMRNLEMKYRWLDTSPYPLPSADGFKDESVYAPTVVPFD